MKYKASIQHDLFWKTPFRILQLESRYITIHKFVYCAIRLIIILYNVVVCYPRLKNCVNINEEQFST